MTDRERTEQGPDTQDKQDREARTPDWGMCALNAVPMDKRLLHGCPFENFGPVDPED